MILNKNLIGCFLLSAFIMAGCEKKDIYKGGEDHGTKKEDFFNYSMKQNVQLNFDYDVPEGFRVYFEAYTENPLTVDEYKNYIKKADVKPFLSGYTNPGGDCSLPVELPDAVKEVYIYSPTAGVPVLQSGKNENGAVYANKQEIVSSKSLQSRANEYWTNWKTYTVNFIHKIDYDHQGTPELVNPGLDISKETQAIIEATIPQGKALDLIRAQIECISLSEDAGVKLYYIDDNSFRKNSLAYYTYTGDEVPSLDYINKNLVLLFPNLTRQALQTGDGVELKYFDGEKWTTTFPEGTNIGFALLVDTWNDQNESVNTDRIHVMYSTKAFNRYDIPAISIIRADRPQMAVFRAGEDVILTFEDQPYTEYDQSRYFGDFRDNIFIIKTDPVTALPDVPDGQQPDEPDGMIVALSSGILAFEDNWPYEGDYDMNDVVLSYKSSVYIKDMTDITGVADTFTFLHAGAKYTNGFGYVLPTMRSNISKVEKSFGYHCPGQGMDEELDEATMMLFDDGGQVAKGTTFAVKLWFKEPVGYVPGNKIHRYAPYNPFIVVRGPQETTDWLAWDRREIHLVRDYLPTPKANASLFHTGKDLSDAKAGYYYVSESNYPFGINVPDTERFKYPASESIRIDALYPDFDSWAKSFGANHKDWYLYPAE